MTINPQHNITAAFFDMDLTILGVNSARRWIEYERQNGRIGRRQTAEAALWLIGYKLGLIDVRKGIVRAVKTLKGAQEEQLARRTLEWYEKHIAQTILPQGKATVEIHRGRGHHLVLLTSSSPYISALVQRDLGIDVVICTQFEVEQGRLTGRTLGPICYGDGKIVRAADWAQKNNVDLRCSHFYTDSWTDLPMLKTVGHPHAINPDPRLRREARRRGWPIEDWIHTP